VTVLGPVLLRLRSECAWTGAESYGSVLNRTHVRVLSRPPELPHRRQPVDVVLTGPHPPPGPVASGGVPSTREGRVLPAVRALEVVVVDEGPAPRRLDEEAGGAVAGLGHRH
jgi:hypothetical protein